jgi:hypothetical protein
LAVRAIYVISAVVVLAGVGVIASQKVGLWPFESEESLLLAKCDDLIKDRLRSPATYQRVEVTDFTRRPANKLEYLQVETPEKLKLRAEQSARDKRSAEIYARQEEMFDSRKMEELSAIISYDAANGYGTPIRSVSMCTIYLDEGEALEVGSGLGVRVDNMTALDWSFEQLRRISEN